MASINKVILVGNAGKDAEIRYLPSGAAVANVSIATTHRMSASENREASERTDWHRLTFWAKLADVAGQYIKKGTQIYVEGRLQYGTYTDANGQEKMTVDIHVNELQLLGGRRQDGGDQGGDNGGYQQDGGQRQQQRPQGQGGYQQRPQGQGQGGGQQRPQGQQGGGQGGYQQRPQGQGQGGYQQRPAPQRPAPAPAPMSQGGGGFGPADDDIPF